MDVVTLADSRNAGAVLGDGGVHSAKSNAKDLFFTKQPPVRISSTIKNQHESGEIASLRRKLNRMRPTMGWVFGGQSHQSRCKKERSRFGTFNTHWRAGRRGEKGNSPGGGDR
ncbi:MAG: hypothetical protein NTY26_01860 [Burkholderiales bacterium]|nr:hypothetical protein [Burkholderiales bacterium]